MNQFIGFQTLLFKEYRRFMRVAGQTIVNPLISASLYLLIFGVNLSESITDQQGMSYLPFIIPGLVAMAILNNSFQNASSSIITSKFHGDLQDLKVVPLSPGEIIAAYSLAATLRGTIVGSAVGMVGEFFHWMKYGAFLPVEHVGLLMVFVILGGLLFGFLGLSISIYAKSFDQVNAIGTFLLVPLTYLGGVFFSVDRMPPFWKAVSHLNPLFYLINGIRYSFLGVSDLPIIYALGVSVCFVMGMFFLARYAVRNGSYTRF